MRQVSRVVTIMLAVVMCPVLLLAQAAQEPSASVPRLINITGVFRPADGQPPAAVETVTLTIYGDEQGGAPLWQETQSVTLDDRGRYSLLLGATNAGGIPPEIFGSTTPHWLATRFERPGEVEGPRVRLTSVPYALRAANADTLGGRPASDYLLSSAGSGDGKAASPESRSDVAGPLGTANFIPKYVDSVNLGDSALYEAGGQVGLGTTTPFDVLHIQYNNPGGNLTGLAVQNMSGSATAYSGMLFFDHNNQLGQFQGFNNSTHEYRINNIARVTPGGAFNGSINFMTGSTSRFFVGSNGNIGIGTTAPSALLEVSNAIPGGPANVWTTSFTNALGPYYFARRARGTPTVPTAVQSGDGLSGIYGTGYGLTGFGLSSGMTIQAAQNWSDTAQGTALTFITTPINSTTPATRMTLDATGNLGIGTTTVPANGILEVSNAGHSAPFAQVTTTTYQSSGQGSLFVGRKARGTAAAPAAVLNNDVLAGFLGRGYGATNFNGTGQGSILVRAAENWTDAFQGTSIQFNTTATNTAIPLTRMTITASGDVGIGTGAPSGALEAAKTGTEANIVATSFGTGEGSTFRARGANGTLQVPTATVLGDELGAFSISGYNATTGFNETAGMAGFAAENFTSTAQGTALAFFATPLATTDPQLYMAINPNGNVGINPQLDVNGFPIVNDTLQVYGDIRVGTSGTNGCVKDFSGAGILGTCSSDRRLKKNITPFAPMLDKVTALQPVHYFWRSDEFPARHFGPGQSDGLIAQDVETVLPDLVDTDSEGYKAINYSKLPLLTIQAVKELKSENDARKAENDALKQRMAELERLIEELLAKR